MAEQTTEGALNVRTTCRACDRPALVDVLSLGSRALCNAFPLPGENVPAFPLDVVLCDPNQLGCGLVQLRHTVSPALLYSRYWYRSGLSTTMREHLAALVRDAEAVVPLKPGDIVLDIGCNDGTTLRAYSADGLQRFGFEPSQLRDEARRGTTAVVGELFNARAFRDVAGGAHARIITTIAMFYDVEDPGRFVEDIRACLAPDGMWVIEMHHLPTMLATNGFDAIVHEHVTYYSLGTLDWLLRRHGLEPFDVTLNPMNGGSFRVFVRHIGAAAPTSKGGEDRIRQLTELEASQRLAVPETYARFGERIAACKRDLRALIDQATANGERVYIYGASTKGNVLLQVYGLDGTSIVAAGDMNQDKWGRQTPATGIPIVSPEQVARARPEYLLVLIWHLLAEVEAQWRSYVEQGGRLIVPLPEVRLIGQGAALSTAHISGSRGIATGARPR